MGIFGKAAPVAPPRTQREDISSAINNAPSRELERLSWAQSELDYLSEVLPREEPVLAVASCDSATAAGITIGVIAVATTRLVAIIGRRDKGGGRGRVLGEPSVEVMEFKRISEFTFGSHNIRGIRGCLASFDLDSSTQLLLNVGQDDAWAEAFLNLAKRQMNRAKLL